MNIVVLGAGTVGTSIADLLCQHRHSVIVVDQDAENIAGINERLDVRAIHGSASQSSVLFQAGVASADLCLAVTGNDEVNLIAASLAKAMGAALFAEKISARQADEWGLIWEAVPEDGFEAAWRGRAEFLATGPTLAFGAIKRVVRATWDNTVEAQLDLEAKEQGVCGQTRDFKEGVLAFSEKRGAKFEGR